ncbi:hypothetical protein [Methylobacterium sp. WL1]|uniref:hypothetical protein n=1 Tax=Methylobacterium sp. WL1 TaxID=2603276 RepID=UPI001FEEDDE5|nr:hypothetical protein [Methylobacterium sp. WL1]
MATIAILIGTRAGARLLAATSGGEAALSAEASCGGCPRGRCRLRSGSNAPTPASPAA